jgi:hypothetical protein
MHCCILLKAEHIERETSGCPKLRVKRLGERFAANAAAIKIEVDRTASKAPSWSYPRFEAVGLGGVPTHRLWGIPLYTVFTATGRAPLRPGMRVAKCSLNSRRGFRARDPTLVVKK